MRVLVIPQVQCSKCLDSYFGIVTEDKTQVSFVHNKGFNALDAQCPDLELTFTVPLSSFLQDL